MKQFRLGLDFDGVITRHPDHLRFLADRILMSGGEVHVITGRRPQDRSETLSRLKEMRFRFTKLHLYPGDYEFEGVSQRLSQDVIEDIGFWKKGMCEELGIDLFMDDHVHGYNTDFETAVVHI